MAIITNDWVGYLDRSYQQIKTSLLNRLVVTNPEITDHSESNILVIILSMFAGLVEMLNYYIDNMAKEAFLISAEKFESAVKLVRILDYRIKARFPETVDVTFTCVDDNGDPVNLASDGVIPKNTVVKTKNGIKFLTIEDLTIPAGSSAGIVGATQTVYKTSINLGTTNGQPGQVVNIGTDYQQATMTLIIDGEAWVNIDTFGLSKPTDKHFIIEIDVDAVAKIVFGDGTNGEIPPNGFTILGTYQTTSGPDAKVDANTITDIEDEPVFAGVNHLTVNNPLGSSGGAFYEGLDAIRKNAPLSIRTLNRAVTRQDYKDLASQSGGVDKADVKYCCGKEIDIFIAPTGGGIAQTPLLDSTKAYLETVKMVTTKLNVQAAGETDIYIKITGKAKFRVNATLAESDAEDTVKEFGSFENQDINSKVRLSDIYRELDLLKTIDYVDIVEFYAIPYARPRGHDTQLTWDRKVVSTSTNKHTWRLEFNSGSTVRIFKDTIYKGQIPLGTTYTDADMEFTVYSGVYTIGMTWLFTSYPFNKNIEIDDYTVPIIRDPNIDINIEAQNSVLLPNSSC